jgi:hypothetical protein
VAEGGGLLSRVQPNTDTQKFSLFQADLLQRAAARVAATVAPFVALPHQAKRKFICLLARTIKEMRERTATQTVRRAALIFQWLSLSGRAQKLSLVTKDKLSRSQGAGSPEAEG